MILLTGPNEGRWLVVSGPIIAECPRLWADMELKDMALNSGISSDTLTLCRFAHYAVK